ncbi:MAG: HAD family hydrolase [Pseudomonadota bacterium]
MTEPSDLSAKTCVLATDLDGTFLGGSEAARRTLYDWIERRRDTVGLIFVTGRDPDFIQTLCREEGVPVPDYAIGDVGTTIARVAPDCGVQPLPALEREIAAAWGDGGARVRAALADTAGLTLQPTAFRYRVSFDLDPARLDPSAEARVTALGYDVLVSDNRFFDVLPRGISKGPSLLRLLDHLGVAPARCLAAGDTLNDLSMLTAGLPAVAVGGAEPALLAALPDAAGPYRATGIGAAGITEAIAHFKLHPGI